MVSNNVAIVTIRNSSKRLPQKPLIEIKDGIRSIDIIIKRAKKTNLSVILATSTDTNDDIFVDVAKEHDVLIFRGALLNKVKRWYDCFQKNKIDNALLVDGDDLAYDFDIGKRAMLQLQLESVDMVMHPKDIVCGFFTYAISKKGISKMYQVVPNESIDTDVITRYIELANLNISYVKLENFEKNKNVRLTLDYNEDLEFFRKLYKNLDILENGKRIIDFLERNKSISQINFHKQDDFLKNQEKFNAKII